MTKQNAVTLDVGESKRLDFTLEIGNVSESVTVTSDASLLNLEKGEVSAVVTERKIVELPLNGRNVYQLAELQPGILRVAGSGLQESETTEAQISAAARDFVTIRYCSTASPITMIDKVDAQHCRSAPILWNSSESLPIICRRNLGDQVVVFSAW